MAANGSADHTRKFDAARHGECLPWYGNFPFDRRAELALDAALYNLIIPKFIAFTAATVLLATSNFRIAFFIWKLTVFSDIPKIIPISHDDFPLATHKIHSFSLRERWGALAVPLGFANFATFEWKCAPASCK